MHAMVHCYGTVVVCNNPCSRVKCSLLQGHVHSKRVCDRFSRCLCQIGEKLNQAAWFSIISILTISDQ